MSEESQVNNNQQEHANQDGNDFPIRDELTDLYNRRYFQEFLETELTRSRRYYRSFSLCFIEVDYMKQYNDAHGNNEGDDLLCFLGNLLKTNIRASDLTCRYGEDEFVLVLPETSKKGAKTVAEKMRKKVEVYPFDGRDSQPNGSVTVSIGVTCFPDDAFEGNELIDNGNKALDKAKSDGGNQVWLEEMA